MSCREDVSEDGKKVWVSPVSEFDAFCCRGESCADVMIRYDAHYWI